MQALLLLPVSPRVRHCVTQAVSVRLALALAPWQLQVEVLELRVSERSSVQVPVVCQPECHRLPAWPGTLKRLNTQAASELQ
eukprot:2978594-Rhodomonas_salina.2